MIVNKRPLINIVFIIIISLACLDFSRANELFIIRETSSELVLRIEFDESFEWRRSEDYPDKVSSLTFGNAYQVFLNEYLEIPYYQWMIALPGATAPKITVTKTVYTNIQLVKNLSAADIAAMNNYTHAHLTDIGYLRDVPSATLEIFPLKPGSKPDELLTLREIELTIHYPSDNVIANQQTEKGEYLDAFVNTASAARWRQTRSLKLQKSQTQPSGSWFRITVKNDGVYAVTQTDLKNAGLTETSIDTGRIFLYSNSTGGRELSSAIGAAVPENLIENTRLISGDGNADFTSSDTILFYGRASSGLAVDSKYALTFKRNAYSAVNYYWLLIADTPGSPKSMATAVSLTSTPDKIVTESEHIEVHEIESVNFLRSGKYWYGEKFSKSGSNVTVLLTLPQTKTSYPVTMTIKTKGATYSESPFIYHYFSLYINSSATATASWQCTNYNGVSRNITTTLNPGVNLLKINYTSSLSSATAYLDYIKCLYTKDLNSFTEPQVIWSPLYSGTVEYQISDLNMTNPVIFDITDWSNVKRQQFSQSGTTVTFRAATQTSQRNQYYLFSPSDYNKPEEIELISSVEWTALRNTTNAYDYIIITDENFRSAAENIAELYSGELPADDRLNTIVVTQDQILREFNADITDPHAIRFFLKYAYENWATRPAYVMLLGDGTFDYRGIESTTGNYVMTYQVEPDENGSDSYASDARFAYINGTDQKMDMAIGRVTIRTATEAQDYYEKLRQYLLEPIYGEWRSRITLVADDPQRPNNNEKYHITDTENSIARYIPKSLMIDKLYLLEYPEVQDASLYGVKKPAATEALLEQLARGTTIINYLGHGSSTVWAQEYMLNMDRDIGLIETNMKLPLWIAGTCSWGHFDDINSTCMPEALIAKAEDGGIAVLTPTRAAYGAPNASFINSFLRKLFPDTGIARIRIGTILQTVYDGSSSNTEKFMLFGDPALYLALPYETATFDKLDSDTLAALEKVRVNGQADTTDQPFSGTGIINVFDSDQYVTRYYLDTNNTTQSLSYYLPGELLFRGSLNIAENAFTSRFIVPKDINYQDLYGSIKIYGWDTNSGLELSGCYDSLKFTGSVQVNDTICPEIVVGFEDLDFKSGDVVPPGTNMKVSIRDANGINIAGKLGHDITFEFDDDADLMYEMTEDFVYDTDSDSSGTITTNLPDLSSGTHQVVIKAWDNANNFTTATAEFTLSSSDKLKLEKVVNYPNPFSSETDFVFYLTQSGNVKISIYTLRGLRIKTMTSDELLTPGFHQMNWDGRDDFGDDIARGIYIYKIQVHSSESRQQDSFIGKMVKS